MRLNKYITIFVGIFLGLNTILFVVLQKYFLVALHHSITFCQEMVKVLSVNLFKNTSQVIFLMLSMIISITIIKLFITIRRIYLLKIDLNKSIVNTSDNITIVNSAKPYAFCFGIRSPKIYISTKLVQMLTKKELEVVIVHENYHLKNHDTITLMLANIFESLVPYFPLISDVIRHYKIERELLADQAAILYQNNDANLVNVLKKLIKYEPQFNYAGIPAIAEIDTLEARINKLTTSKDFNKKFNWNNLIISTISLIFLLVLIFIPINSVEVHSKGSDTVILCVDNNMSSYYTL
ncbi:MAG: hypothetical protein ACD_19C00017G0020 [uncultured bacterium]|nr:MAG: hypothetical protein ACD_19C00017G0020 [uncultured bacterium]